MHWWSYNNFIDKWCRERERERVRECVCVWDMFSPQTVVEKPCLKLTRLQRSAAVDRHCCSILLLTILLMLRRISFILMP